MPIDVRINEVTSDVHVTDASAMLTPEVLQRIVRAVIEHLDQRARDEREQASERSLGNGRRHGVDGF